MVLGVLAIVLGKAAAPSPFLSDVLLALAAGTLLANTKLGAVIKLAPLGNASNETDPYAAGLRFTGQWILRLGIILMGLRVEARVFGLGSLGQIAAVIAVTLPVTFFVIQALAVPLGIRRPLADLIAGGTMICGASAVTAVAPVVGSRRQEQGLALATVFFFSVVALVVFKPIALALGMDPSLGGLWGGLAVNDLSSAIAVGAQMGPNGSEMAAAAKSGRVLLLGPLLLCFALLRSDQARPKDLGKRAAQLLPRFVLGYAALAVLRAVGDRFFAHAGWWQTTLSVDRTLVSLCLVAVSASIGLRLDARSLLAAGPRTLALGAAGSFTMSGLSLTLLLLLERGALSASAWLGMGALALSFAGFKLATGQDAETRAARLRFAAGAPLSLTEAVNLLRAWDAEGAPQAEQQQRLMEQLHPSTGELMPVRFSPLPHGDGCRWATYWEGSSGWALVAVCREPGAATPIHAHSHALVGKSIEGRLEEIRFSVHGSDALLVQSRQVLDHDRVMSSKSLSAIHIIRVVGDTPAIDLQLRGPECGQPGVRYIPKPPLDLTTLGMPSVLEVGTRVSVAIEVDDRPGQAGEGAAGGLLPAMAKTANFAG
jgi:uncharacterized membrane protein YadS